MYIRITHIHGRAKHVAGAGAGAPETPETPAPAPATATCTSRETNTGPADCHSWSTALVVPTTSPGLQAVIGKQHQDQLREAR
jgi:hypothetical protein